MDELSRDHWKGNPLDRIEDLERRIAELERFAITRSGPGSGLDADTVDGAHAGDGPNEVLLLDGSGNAVPDMDASQDIGSSALRWRHLYHSGYQRNVYAAALAMQVRPWESNPLVIHGSRLSTTIYSQDPCGNTPGILTGTWTATSGPGGYQVFDGSTYVTFSSVTTTNPISLPLFSAWVYFTNSASVEETIASKWGTGQNQKTWRLYRATNGTIKFEVSRDGNTVAGTSSDGIVGGGVWKDVLARYESTGGNLYLYVNGIQYTAGSGGTGTLFSSASTAFMVGALTGGTSPLTGRIGLPWYLAVSRGSAEPSTTVVLDQYNRTRDAFGV